MNKDYLEMMCVFDSPFKYKKLEIFPAKMKDYYLFYTLATCLFLERTSPPDPKLVVKTIGMTYLEYLFFMSNEENKLVYFLDGLLRIVLGKMDDKMFHISYGEDEYKRPIMVIDGEKYNSDDFDEIREIIAIQNLLELPDETIQKNVRDSLEEARKLKEKIRGSKVASTEEQIIALSLYTGWDMEKISNLSIRKFQLYIRRANHMIMSNIYLSASMSGMVTFKDKSILKGWLADIDSDDRYSDVKLDPEELRSKVNFEDNKANT